MEERFIRVERTARFHVLGDIRTCRELWVVVHGYGQLGRYFLNNFTGMEEGRCIVAPEGLSRFYLDAEHSRVGATWMTREDRLHEIEDHIAYLDRLTAKHKPLKDAVALFTRRGHRCPVGAEGRHVDQALGALGRIIAGRTGPRNAQHMAEHPRGPGAG